MTDSLNENDSVKFINSFPATSHMEVDIRCSTVEEGIVEMELYVAC